VLALALRLATIDQSLYGDEVLTYDIVSRNGLFDVLRAVHDTSVTPPFHYLLAWLAVQAGDATTWVRVPSLVLGTATVPLTYLLGLRTVGRPAGLLGAALVALSPFAIFYSVEARAYATLIFLIAASSLALVSALQTGRRRWWVVYVVCAALVLYTHYTGVFAVAAQAGWALWSGRARLREVVVAHVAVAIAYLPWLPSYLNQRGNKGIGAIEALAPSLSPRAVVTALLNVLPGLPFAQLRELPGRPALIAFLGVLAVAVAAAAVRAARRLSAGGRLDLTGEQVLLVLVAVATPAGVVAYSLGSTDLLLPRNLGASLCATALVLGWLVLSLPRAAALAATAVLLAALAVGTVETLGDEHRRPAAKEAAYFVDSVVRPGDVLVYSTVAGDLHVYRKRPLRTFLGVDDRRGWRYAEARGGRVIMLRPYFGFFAYAPKPPEGLDRNYRVTARRVYTGFQTIAVLVYTPRPGVSG
jgi:mannosyltransferase